VNLPLNCLFELRSRRRLSNDSGTPAPADPASACCPAVASAQHSFQHADHPRTVEANKLCLNICIEPKIHDHVFATLESLQPVNTASQRLNFSRQTGFQLRPFRFVLWSRNLPSIVAVGSARLGSPGLRALGWIPESEGGIGLTPSLDLLRE
jgi:hypothetical protein